MCLFVPAQCAPWFFPWKVIISKHHLFSCPKITACGFNRECCLNFHRHAVGTGVGWRSLSPQAGGDTCEARDSRHSGKSCVAPGLGKGSAFQLLKFNSLSPPCRAFRIKSNKFLLPPMEPVQIPGSFLALGAWDMQLLHSSIKNRESRP